MPTHTRNMQSKNKLFARKEQENFLTSLASMVREVGFEPTNPYGTGAYGQTHDLQACAFKSS